ncbi:MAG: B12-binding domain-containing radical SAM protein [Proteobacteria bacterium]|nr:B12-binding domain-containing radical SAM protein [Pseudomonadota bacterium]
MKILLVYPKYPDTFWSYKYALKFISKKACSPPLGLLTLAAMLPHQWEKKIVDLNVKKLTDRSLKWADYVFISAMSSQTASVQEIISRCNSIGVKVVAGGPLFSTAYESFQGIDHFVLDEAELTLPLFLEDLKNGQPEYLYRTDQWADISKTPVPLWHLIDINKYASMNIQYSRGCPFHCDFCSVANLFGNLPRTKDKDQVIAELESLYAVGWREGVLFVDDNFIGNKVKLKKDVLPALIAWMEQHKYPFSFHTESSINLADDPELMQMMVMAGFDTVFVGLETPNEQSSLECNKFQNKGRDLIKCVKIIQHSGLQVQGGFIIGFDNDPASIFEMLIRFIQESAVVTAMVGLLNAPQGTRLYQRLKKEGRLLKDSSGDSMDLSINFIPRMNYEVLINGYRKVLSTIYSPRHYYERLRLFLKEYNPPQQTVSRIRLKHIEALLKSILYIGIIGKERFHFWELIFWSLLNRPRLFVLAITLAICGFHFRRAANRIIKSRIAK